MSTAMPDVSNKEAKVQFYVLFFGIVAITLFFVLPDFVDYVKGEKWVEVEVKPKNKKHNIINKDSIYEWNQERNATLNIDSYFKMKVRPDKGWGLYFLVREVIGYIIFFLAFWYVLKLLKQFKTERNFENDTASTFSFLGGVILLGGFLAFADKYFLNLFLLKKMGFPNYKISVYAGEFLLFGAMVIYFGRYYRKGLDLKKENDLTV